jgi:hypothetical protein
LASVEKRKTPIGRELVADDQGAHVVLVQDDECFVEIPGLVDVVTCSPEDPRKALTHRRLAVSHEEMESEVRGQTITTMACTRPHGRPSH